jgi:hypothetical protein
MKGFESPKVKKKINKSCHISIVGFQCVAKNIERWLNFCVSYLNYSQIWLNLLRDNRHFSYIFLWMVATLAPNKNSRKKP